MASSPARAPERSRGLGLIAAIAALTPSGRAGVPVAWALYDFANTIYSYAVVSYAMGLWTVDRLGPSDGQFWFGVANAASVGLNAAISPVLGAISDRGGRRLPYLLFFTGMCVVGTAAIALVPGRAAARSPSSAWPCSRSRTSPTRRRSSTTTRRCRSSRSPIRAAG